MSEYTLDFIGRTLLEMRADLRDFRADMVGVKRDLAQLRDEALINTAWLMRDKAEPIAADRIQEKWEPVFRPECGPTKTTLQSQLQRMNARMDAMESRVGAVESRLPAE